VLTPDSDNQNAAGIYSVAPQPRLGGRFIALYVLANVGAYIAFIPLLQILVPLRAAAIDPAHGAVLLSRVAFCGAVAASLANILFGALSDRTRSTIGDRRPWLIAGLAAILLAYTMISQATTPPLLLAGVVAFQLAFNAMFAPLGAVLADDVPNVQKGLVSALLGLGYPLGNIVGTQAVGALVVTETARFAVLGALVAAFIAPFVWQLGRRPSRPASVSSWRTTLLINPLAHPDFARAIAGRLLVVTAFSLVQGYLLLYLRHIAADPGQVPGRPEAAFATLATIGTVANIASAVLAGYLSDRTGQRSLFVFAGGATMAAGIVWLGFAQSWAGLQGASVVYGCGAGIYYAVDLALIVQVLPSLRNAGKDLGIVNLSNTIPQMVAPLIALAMLSGPTPSFRGMFLLGAAAALLGAACVLGIGPARIRNVN
jgi:MFS family permease